MLIIISYHRKRYFSACSIDLKNGKTVTAWIKRDKEAFFLFVFFSTWLTHLPTLFLHGMHIACMRGAHQNYLMQPLFSLQMCTFIWLNNSTCIFRLCTFSLCANLMDFWACSFKRFSFSHSFHTFLPKKENSH